MNELPPPFRVLGAYRQFCIWKLAPSARPGKMDKLPCDWRNGAVTNAHSPATWGSFEECAGAVRTGLGDGIGFVFTDNDPFWFLDIDGAMQADGDWSPLSVALCERLPGAAVEVSQSHKGLHIIGSGQIPDHGCKNVKLGLELYHTGRFVALTGISAVGNAAADLTAQLSVLVTEFFDPAAVASASGPDEWTDEPVPEWDGPVDDDDLIRRALASGSRSAAKAFGGDTAGVTFPDLWERNVDALSAKWPSPTDGDFDASSADMALAAHLAFWTGKNPERIRTLMYRSALVRDKWDDRGDYYLPRTILRACSLSEDVAKGASQPLQQDEKPRPLFRELPAAPAFPLDALGPELKSAAAAIEAIVQCPLACAANSVLAVASLASQGCADVVLPIGQGKRAPLSLFILTVLESGERKSTADNMALKPVREIEREWSELRNSQLAAHQDALTAYEANRKHLVTALKENRAELEAALKSCGPEPKPPLLSVIAPSGDQTMEGLFRIFENGRPSLAMLCDDAATFLGGHSLRAEQKRATTGNLCRAWDGSRLERIRGGDGVTVLNDRRLSMHLMVQPGVASDFLSDPQFADQGLLARCLVSAPMGRAGTRLRDDSSYKKQCANAAVDLQAYNAAARRLLNKPVQWIDENDRSLGVERAALELSSDARALYVAFNDEIEGKLGPHGELASVKPFASKLAENAARIAGILTMIANPDANQIEEVAFRSAMKLARHYLEEALRLFASGAVDPSLKQAEELRVWLCARSTREIGLPQIYQLGPSSTRDAKTAREAMAIICEHGWAAPIEGGAKIDGQTYGEAYRIVCDATA